VTYQPDAMPPELVADWRSLSELIDRTHQRDPVPCKSGAVVSTSYWTSDNTAEAALAMQACGHCPIKAACYAYGIKHVTESGIYAGMGPKQRKAVAKLSTDLPPSTTNPN